MSNKNDYNEQYYKTLNYVDYLNKLDKYKHTAKEIVILLEQLCLLDKNNSQILDYGCAVGFLMEGLKEAGCKFVDGYDISEWACEYARESGHNIVNSIVKNKYDILFALDVFEHMDDNEIYEAILDINPKTIIARIPSSMDEGKTFYLPVSQRDITHVNCKSKQTWISFFKQMNYFAIKINLCSIYDTDGVTCLLLTKQ